MEWKPTGSPNPDVVCVSKMETIFSSFRLSPEEWCRKSFEMVSSVSESTVRALRSPEALDHYESFAILITVLAKFAVALPWCGVPRKIIPKIDLNNAACVIL
jgi:hypothetical protein